MSNSLLNKLQRTVNGWRRPARTDGNARLPLPLQKLNHEGKERRVGVEFEFTGLTMEHIARIVRDCIGGQIDPLSAYEYKVVDTPVGDFKVELDYAYLKKLGRRENPAGGVFSDIERLSEDMLAAVAKRVVPFEIVCPPIELSRLGLLEDLVAALRAAGARGTDESPIYAFGMHFNPELPALDANTVRDYLRAYMVLFSWLQKVSEVDVSRRVFPFIQPYPKEYHRLVCAAGYEPEMSELIDDYLLHNPSRNRALDMLPLFSFIDEARVKAAVEDELVNARPTLHYRLPNCEIERASWNIGTAWRHWLRVEHLASEPELLEQSCAAYNDHLNSPLGDLIDSWADKVEPWVQPENAL